MKMVYDYPGIVDASPLGGYKLLIDWSSGEQTIFDASTHMNSHMALPYRSPDEFNKVKVHPGFLYWGTDEEAPEAFMIMQDNVYDASYPYVAIMSSGIQTYLPMSYIIDMPYCLLGKKFQHQHTQAFVHVKDADYHKEPHVHVYIQKAINVTVPFKLDGSLIPGIILPNPPFSNKILKALKKWIMSNRQIVVTAWNKANGMDSHDNLFISEVIK